METMHKLGLQESLNNRIFPFWPVGSDERQYCSPGFDLPVGCICRSFYGVYPQYHTSADNLEVVCGSNLARSVSFL